MAVGPMTDRELQDWLNAHGGERSRADATKPTKSQDPQTGAEVTGSEVHTTVTAADGATITLKRIRPSGEENLPGPVRGGPAYEIIGQDTATTKPTAASATPNATALNEAQAAEELRERQWNQANGGMFETHAERKAREAKDAAPKPQSPVVSRRTEKNEQTGQTVTINTHADNTETRDETQVIEKPEKPGAKYSQVKQDETTGKWHGLKSDGTWEEMEGGPGAQGLGPPTPSSATGWDPDPSQIDMGVGARQKAVAGMLEAGTFGDPTSPTSVAKANALLKQDYDHAKLVSDNLGNIQQTEQTVYQGGISQRNADVSTVNQRLQAATTMYNNVLSEIWGKAAGKASGKAIVGAIEEMLNNSRIFAQQFGGLVDHPRIQPGANMTRTSDLFKPPGGATAATAAPQASAAVAGSPAAEPFTPPPTGAPGGTPLAPTGIPGQPAPVEGGAPEADPFAPSPPPTLDPEPGDGMVAPPGAVEMPMQGWQPDLTSMAGRAMQAQRLFGQQPAAAPAPPTPIEPSAQPAPVDPTAPKPAAGTLGWARRLGFDEDVIAAFMAIEAQELAGLPAA